MRMGNLSNDLGILLTVMSARWAIEPGALQSIIELAEGVSTPAVALEAHRALALEGAQGARIRDGIAILDVYGPMFRRANILASIFQMSSYDVLRRDLQSAIDDPAVKGILLNVDSPGGEVNGASELAQAVFGARGRKPIVAYVGGQGSSAAYWLLSGADGIVVNETAQLGSLGVVATVTDRREADRMNGVVRHEIVSSQSPHKRADVATDAGRSRIQASVDSIADVFVAQVAQHRGVTRERVLSDFGRGDVFVGKAAVDAGLADEVGNFEQVLGSMVAGRKWGRKTAMVTSNTSAVRPLTTARTTATLSAASIAAEAARIERISALTLPGYEADAAEAIRTEMAPEAFATGILRKAKIAADAKARAAEARERSLDALARQMAGFAEKMKRATQPDRPRDAVDALAKQMVASAGL
ncbi:MAG: hypothetical protein QOC72_3936 [Methylobacteriaceae bacterium]|jgi:signal peptide peptidase SppA|nr:hypothetical protein [Methylobacteriaceae bacterium]